MKFHQNIPYGYLIMAHTRIVCKKTNQRAVTQKLRNFKGRAIIFVCNSRVDLIHIAMKFHQNIPYGYLVMPGTRNVYPGWTDG